MDLLLHDCFTKHSWSSISHEDVGSSTGKIHRHLIQPDEASNSSRFSHQIFSFNRHFPCEGFRWGPRPDKALQLTFNELRSKLISEAP